MPDILKLCLRHCAIGFALSAVFTAILLAMNVGQLRTLAGSSADGLLGLALLFVSNGFLFGVVQIALKLLGDDDDDDDHGGGGRLRRDRVAIPVRVDER